MPIFNDVNLKEWKQSEILTDSLWIIRERDKSGKHSGFYHGNFIPQIPRQMITRFTREGETVFDPFLGSGTTAFEAEALGRNFVGVDIQSKMVQYVRGKVDNDKNFSVLITGDSTSETTNRKIRAELTKRRKFGVQLAILHPPYADIIKFSDNPRDISNHASTAEFLESFGDVVKHTVDLLDKGRHLIIVIGDKYSGGEWIPLGFRCLDEALKHGLTLKSIVVKNMEGNRAKQNKDAIWRYRALSSDYYIFKHEYILVLRKK